MPSINRRVLVVDDDPDLADALRDVLQVEGYEVTIAHDGLDALDQLAAMPPPALILLDWWMPRCDGPSFRARQRADPSIAEIPVVIFSAGRFHSESFADETAPVMKKSTPLDDLLPIVARYFGHN